MTTDESRLVLITGGTGMQGRPTVVQTLKKGIRVRALVRDIDSKGSRDLAALGAELVQGSFQDQASLDRAAQGVSGVFSLQLANPAHGSPQQENLVKAAQKAGIEQFIQSSVSSTGLHESFVDWDAGRWSEWYWHDKHQQEERVRQAGFRYWTMVRPAMLMDNYLPYRAQFMHADLLTTGDIVTAARPDVPVAYVSSQTVGLASAHAFADPERFHNVDMELADDMVSHQQIVDILSDVTGKPVAVVSVPYAELVARGVFEGLVSSQDWLNDVGYAARPEMLTGYGLTPLPFRAWAADQASEFRIGSPAMPETPAKS